VLVVDDDPCFTELVDVLLDSDRSTLVGRAADGAAGVERALELRPDVVVMDVEMPVLDGVAAAGRLRRELPGARVIFVSGSADLELVTRARALGADSFVHKGRVFHELLDAVAAPMAAAASAA